MKFGKSMNAFEQECMWGVGMRPKKAPSIWAGRERERELKEVEREGERQK